MNNIEIEELNEAELSKYGSVFAAVYDLLGDYTGIFFKLRINGIEHILQRKEDLFVLYTVENDVEVSCEMFTVDENYVVNNAGFDDFEMSTCDGGRIVKPRDTQNLESLTFAQRRDGCDVDGYDGTVAFVQYNQEKDVRLILTFQQMYNSAEKVYSFHVDKCPLQILIEKGVVAKENGSILPVRTYTYVRGDYDEVRQPTLYNIATIKDFGLVEFLEKGAFSLQKDPKISRYYRVLGVRANGYAITSFPLGKQYKYQDFEELFLQYGFKSKIPDYLIAIHNDEDVDLKRYQEIANFMKEIEMIPPDEVITLNLKFEGEHKDDTNS